MSEEKSDLEIAIEEELKRCRELLKQYEEIGPSGTFGHICISQDIERGEKALKTRDVVDMVRALAALQGCE